MSEDETMPRLLSEIQSDVRKLRRESATQKEINAVSAELKELCADGLGWVCELLRDEEPGDLQA